MICSPATPRLAFGWVAPKQSVIAAQVCRKSSLAGLGVSCLHPAAPITRVRVDRGGERGIAQLSPSGAVQLRVTKRAYWAGTSQNDSADPRGICVAGYGAVGVAVGGAAARDRCAGCCRTVETGCRRSLPCIRNAYADFVSCRLRARSDGPRSAGGCACRADAPLPDRFQRLNPGGLLRTGDA